MDATELISKLAISLSNNVYQDGLSPAVKNLGQALGDITSAIQLVTLPFAFLGDTAAALKDKYRDFINETYAKVPDEKKVLPDKTIVYDIIKSVLPSIDKNDIREIYSNLLASASDMDKKSCVHPSFSFLISQLGSTEVILLEEINASANKSLPYIEVFGFIKHSNMPIQIIEPVACIKGYEKDYKKIATAIQTLLRLQILRKQPSPYDNKKLYDMKLDKNTFEYIKKDINFFANDFGKIASTSISEGLLMPTILGIDFINTCSSYDK